MVGGNLDLIGYCNGINAFLALVSVRGTRLGVYRPEI